MSTLINLLVEGDLDDAVGRRLIREVGATPGHSFGKQGSGYIRKRIVGFNASVGNVPLLTLVDFMDMGAECPPEAIRSWLPHPDPKMIFRAAVREIESWLLADRASIASFLMVPIDKIPRSPEELSDPKLTLINLARRSRSRRIREALVPDVNSSAATGQLYNSELAAFANGMWDAQAAAQEATSLSTCIRRLRMNVRAYGHYRSIIS